MKELEFPTWWTLKKPVKGRQLNVTVFSITHFLERWSPFLIIYPDLINLLPITLTVCLNTLLIYWLHSYLSFQQITLNFRKLCLFCNTCSCKWQKILEKIAHRRKKCLRSVNVFKDSQIYLIYVNMISKQYVNRFFSYWATTLPLLQMNSWFTGLSSQYFNICCRFSLLCVDNCCFCTIYHTFLFAYDQSTTFFLLFNTVSVFSSSLARMA